MYLGKNPFKPRRDGTDTYERRGEIITLFKSHKNWQRDNFSITKQEICDSVFGRKEQIHRDVMAISKLAYDFMFSEGGLIYQSYSYKTGLKFLKKTFGITILIVIRGKSLGSTYYFEPSVEQIDIEKEKRLRQGQIGRASCRERV